MHEYLIFLTWSIASHTPINEKYIPTSPTFIKWKFQKAACVAALFIRINFLPLDLKKKDKKFSIIMLCAWEGVFMISKAHNREAVMIKSGHQL